MSSLQVNQTTYKINKPLESYIIFQVEINISYKMCFFQMSSWLNELSSQFNCLRLQFIKDTVWVFSDYFLKLLLYKTTNCSTKLTTRQIFVKSSLYKERIFDKYYIYNNTLFINVLDTNSQILELGSQKLFWRFCYSSKSQKRKITALYDIIYKLVYLQFETALPTCL